MRLVGVEDSRGFPRVQTVNELDSETVQSDAHLADIHQIMRTFELDGLQNLEQADLMFKDVSEFTDLADAMAQAREAEVVFLRLPAPVRLIFENDVAVWLDAAHDEEKQDALVEAGYLKRVEPVGTKKSPTGIEEDPVKAGKGGTTEAGKEGKTEDGASE